MPKSRSKSKSRKKRGPASSSASLRFGGRYPAAKKRRNYIITGVVGLIAIGAIGASWLSSVGASRSFVALAAEGEAALAQVETQPSRGQTHLQPGQGTNYGSQFPLSGPHHRVPARPGFYDAPQLPIQLVHALEHGHVVIYYDQPDDADLDELKSWADLYTGGWDGVVVTPMAGLRGRVVLTAWAKRLTLSPFDAASAAAFIDAYRGRGPENRVR